MESKQTPEQYVVVMRHSGHTSSDRDKPSVVFGPASERDCSLRRDELNAYYDLGSTSYAAVMKATVTVQTEFDED